MRHTRRLSAGVLAVLLACSLGRAEGGEQKATRPLGKFTVFSVPGRYGYIDTTGRFVLENLGYDRLCSFSEGLAAVCRWRRTKYGLEHDRWTFIDRKGKRVLAADATYARDFSEGLAAVYVGGKVIGGGAGSFAEAHIPDDGRPRPPSLWRGKWGYVDRTGAFVIPPQFTRAAGFRESLAAVIGPRESGYIDKTGKLVIRSDDSVRLRRKVSQRDAGFSEGLAPFSASRDAEGYINRVGKVAIPAGFRSVWNFREGRARVEIADEKYGYIDKSGKLLGAGDYESARDFSEGRAAVRKGGKWGYIDLGGKVVVGLRYTWCSRFSCGLAAVGLAGKWGYIDKDGKTVVPPRFDDALPFASGLAAVSVRGKWGYIDKSGRLVVQPQYAAAGYFHNGIARVSLDGILEDRHPLRVRGGGWRFIDTTGRAVGPFTFDHALDFRDSLAAALIRRKYGLKDAGGRVVLPPQFDFVAQAFRDGMARVSRRGRWGFLDEGGRVAIGPRFESVRDFGQGLAAARDFAQGPPAPPRPGKFGFLDKSGTFVLPPAFDDAGVFSEGLAAVKPKHRWNAPDWGYIDRTGKLVIRPAFHRAREFSQGLAAVWLDGGCGFIDRSGQRVIAARFYRAREFANGLAPASLAASREAPERWGFVDRRGKWAVPAVFEDVAHSPDGRQRGRVKDTWYRVDRSRVLYDPSGKKIGPAVDVLVPGFLRALKDKNADLRADAVCCLGRLGGPRAVAALEPLETSRDWRVCMLASLALEEAGQGSAIERLLPRLAAEDQPARQTAFAALCGIAREPRHAVELLGLAERAVQAHRGGLVGQAAMPFVAGKAAAKVRTVLAQRIAKLVFEEIPLSDTVEFFQDVTGLNVYVNWRALAEAGIKRSTPLTMNRSDVPAGEALQVMCSYLTRKHHPVGYGVVDGVIVVSTLEDLYALAGALLQSAGRHRAAGDAESPVGKKLRQKIAKFDLNDIPLDGTITFLRDLSDLKIAVLWNALRKLGIDRGRAVTLNLQGLPVAAVLRFVLLDAGGTGVLEYRIDDGRIIITPAADRSGLSTRRTAVLALCEALKHDDRDVRAAAAVSLGKIGPAAKAAIPDLIQALKDPADPVRKAAAEALKKIQAGR